jgi:hypothetical protein
MLYLKEFNKSFYVLISKYESKKSRKNVFYLTSKSTILDSFYHCFKVCICVVSKPKLGSVSIRVEKNKK